MRSSVTALRKPASGCVRIWCEMPPASISRSNHRDWRSLAAETTRGGNSPGGAHNLRRTSSRRPSAAAMWNMKMPRQSKLSRGYEVLTISTFIESSPAWSARRSDVALIHQRCDLLGDQPDQEHDHRGREQQHAHVGEAVLGDVGVDVIAEAAHEECAAGRSEQFQRRVQRGDLEDDQQEAHAVA